MRQLLSLSLVPLVLLLALERGRGLVPGSSAPSRRQRRHRQGLKWHASSCLSPSRPTSLSERCLASRHDFLSDVVAEEERSGLQRPSVTLKVALDANGAVDEHADTESKRFTCGASLDLVHRLRADADAVAVGIGTVLRDDPSLTVRRVPLASRPSLLKSDGSGDTSPRQPLRVIFDSQLRIPKTATVLADEHATQIFCLEEYVQLHAQNGQIDVLMSPLRHPPSASTLSAGYEGSLKHAHGLPSDSSGLGGLRDALAFLRRERGVRHLMLEGGPTLVKTFLKAKCVDRAIVITAPEVSFSEPVFSGGLEDDETLTAAGLQPLNEAPGFALGQDYIRCWSRQGLPWPGVSCTDWP